MLALFVKLRHEAETARRAVDAWLDEHGAALLFMLKLSGLNAVSIRTTGDTDHYLGVQVSIGLDSYPQSVCTALPAGLIEKNPSVESVSRALLNRVQHVRAISLERASMPYEISRLGPTTYLYGY